MLIIIQRVARATVTIENNIVTNISKGIFALVCVEETDDTNTFNNI